MIVRISAIEIVGLLCVYHTQQGYVSSPSRWDMGLRNKESGALIINAAFDPLGCEVMCHEKKTSNT